MILDDAATRDGHSIQHGGARDDPIRERGSGAARDLVARDFSLLPRWLNPGPAKLLEFGLPDGFAERLERRDYDAGLVVYFASRYDQIHFKLYAAVDENRAHLRRWLPWLDNTLSREDINACLAYGARAVDHAVVQAA